MSRMKMLAVCDMPHGTSGFARVSSNLLRRWSAEADIDCWGVGFVGWGYRRAPYVQTMLPGGADWASPPKLDLLLAQLSTGAYTHLFMMQDTFLLSAHNFPARMREICRRKGIHSTLYFPVDAPLDPLWTDIIAAVDCPVAYTTYGKHEAELKGRLRGHSFECEVIPHGVDTSIYQTLPDRGKLRRGLWDPAWVNEGDFLMINVNANQRRKDVVRSLEVLKALLQRGVPAKLLMHMPESSAEGLSLAMAGEQLELEPVRHWGHSDPLYRRGHALLTEQDLTKFYNAADFYLTTSLGEGWGLGITEALACGCSAGVPLHTACAEVAKRVNELWGKQRIVGLPVETHGVVCDWDNSRVRHRVNVEAGADQIAAYYNGGEWRERPELPQTVEQWLSWDRIAAKMLRLMRRKAASPRAYTHYLEYGGGLGDVLAQLFHKGSYNALRDLKPGEKARVAIISHNPFVKELFAGHPKRSQIEVLDCGYWCGAEADAANRKRLGLPPAGALDRLPPNPTPESLEFYPLPEDQAVIEEAKASGKPIITLALSAGLPDRTVPVALAEAIVRRLARDYQLVLVGRAYDRHGRSELHWHQDEETEGVIDAVDRLSVPGSCALVQASAGLVTAHSALNLLAWHLRKPQLLLYPRSAWERHMRVPDQWAFGIAYPETVHASFEDCEEGNVVNLLLERFEIVMRNLEPHIAAPAAGVASGQ
jgi:glycosyltransferase involved in cell wall biosynthesis